MRLSPVLRRRRRWTSLVSSLVLGGAAVLFVASAVLADGFPIRHVDLNDGGIWVTSDSDGLFGRINKPAGSLDAVFNPPGGAQKAYQLDVVQDGAAVAAIDRAGGRLLAVDVNRAVTVGDRGLALAAGQMVALSGGTLAVLDPKAGKVWASRVDTGRGLSSFGALEADQEPLASVGGDQADAKAALAVGLDGTVYAVSAAGRLATVRPDGPGFTKPDYADLKQTFAAAQITAVGGQPVVFDSADGKVVVPGGRWSTVADSSDTAMLQVPGPDAAAVVVATAHRLLSIALSDGSSTVLSEAGAGAPARPVRLDSCIHAAWASTRNGYVRACGGKPALPGALKNATTALQHPEFRVNRGAIVLNDLATGAVWDLATQLRLDNWAALKPPVIRKHDDNRPNKDPLPQTRNLPPKAVDDTLGARPNRTTLLHLLDNDSDPGGGILTISAVTAPDSASAKVAIAPDGQTVAVAIGNGSGAVHFQYTVNDGELTDTANVAVQIRAPGENTPPKLRNGYVAPAWTVPAGGRLSLTVLDDWRDLDGDPITLASARVKAGSAVPTPDGRIDFAAPATGGPQKVDYQVTDGLDGPEPGTVSVAVQGPTATTAVAAITQPDVARGEVGQPIEIRPLDNDLPGSDPTTPNPRLQLGGDVASPLNTAVVSDRIAGRVVLTATKPGTYRLAYLAAFGNADFAKGTIRVDVVPVPGSPAPPVAMPDTAVLRGQYPATVDVLANDFDPSGALLTVQHAAIVRAESRLQVAVIDGHWLRISAQAATGSPEPEVVRYTITDGVTGPVTGEVTVSRRDAPPSSVPVPRDDYATVRAGGIIAVAVLDNDTNEAGTPMSLLADVPGAPSPGRLAVMTSSNGAIDAGAAYAAGALVRYVAPPASTTPLPVAVDYVVQNPSGDRATGHLHITVTPAPSTTNPNHGPKPLPIEARAVAGQTVTIPVALGGVDPDGDDVSVVGIGSAPALGRIVATSATSLVYQAFPTSAGTDLITYQIADRFGATASSTVRVAVTPPTVPQPPVAVDDQVTAAPGAHLRVDVLANDLRDGDDVLSIEPLEKRNPSIAGGARLADPVGPIELTAPDADGHALTVVYGVTDGIGEPSLASLNVRSQAGYNNPPRAADAFPALDGAASSVVVEADQLWSDVDGPAEQIGITRVFDSTATVAGSSVTVPVTDRPRVVAYEIRDGGGATAIGLIHVPAAGTGGAPYPTPGKRITLPKNGSVTIALSDYVTDPAGKAVRLTTADRVWGSPASALKVANPGATSLTLTARNGYTGPAAVTFEVTDGATLTDPQRRTAVIQLPVQIGPQTPVLRCPADPLVVVEGGAPLAVDVTAVCHVWTADPADRDHLTYDVAWQRPIRSVGVTGSGSRTVGLSAESAAVPGAVGTLEVTVHGADATPGLLPVRVAAPAPPSLAPITVDGVKAGGTATVDITGYMRSQLREPAISVISAAQSSGPAARTEVSGATVRITPGADTHGTMRFIVNATDVADTSRADRFVTGQITLQVLGVPDAPAAPAIDRTVRSESVQISWTAPAGNGAPITAYEVAYPGGTQECPASPCLVTGLHNGDPYTFKVRARNVVGWGKQSPASAATTPNEVPPAVVGLAVSNPQDGSLALAWTAPVFKGTKITKYEVSWTNGGRATVTGTSTVATGLINDSVYTFTVVAVNALGPGPATTVQGQSAGAPPQPPAPSLSSTDSADHNSRTVVVSWPAVDPNGPGPTTYTVERSGGGTKTICADVVARTCDDDGLSNDGTIYTYTVTAKNAVAATDPAAHTSAPSPGTQLDASSTPDPITGVSATPTGADGQATLTFDAPPSHGPSSTVTCTWSGNSCGTWTFSTAGQTGVTKTINGLPNGQGVTISLQDCNGSTGTSGAGSPCNTPATTGVTTYGPLKNLTISTSANGQDVNFTVSVDPNGKAATVTISTSKQNRTFTTGVGAWSWSSTDTVGYSSSDTITVTVSDPGRTSLSGSKSQSTPPPPPTVTVTKGTPCGGGGGAACVGGTCSATACAYIRVTTANFSGNVTCTFDSQHGSGGFVTNVYGANQTKDSSNWYGYKNEWVTATCGGVTSPRFIWY